MAFPPALRSARCMLTVRDHMNSCVSCWTPAVKCEPIFVKFATIEVGTIVLCWEPNAFMMCLSTSKRAS